jgi:hypothetical protein
MPYSSLLVLPFQELGCPETRDSTCLSYTASEDKTFHGMILDAKNFCPRNRSRAKLRMSPRDLLIWHFEQCVVRCFRENFPVKYGRVEAEKRNCEGRQKADM